MPLGGHARHTLWGGFTKAACYRRLGLVRGSMAAVWHMLLVRLPHFAGCAWDSALIHAGA